MATVSLPAEELEDEPRSSRIPEAEERFGRYRLCFELASGGMGKVFLARAEGPRGFEKLVALKRIHPHLAERRAFVEMFLDEARLTSRIDHPNVCTVFDFGEEGGTYYIAMEYLFGEPLSQVLRAALRHDRGDPRRIPYCARILADACEGLHAAHELRGPDGEPLHVIHRDVSPHNIFVTYDGGARVVDFGIARAADQLHETTTGSVKGKWAYMAPEQARGKKVDRRADIWSLGVVLWEAATGRRLFRRENQTETVLAVVGEAIPTPSTVEPSVPPEIDEIVMRALERDVSQRWASARAMGRALSHYLASKGRPIGLVEIGEWMGEIFPGAREEKRALLHEATEGRAALAEERSTEPRSPDAARERKPSVATAPAKPPARERKASVATAPAKRTPRARKASVATTPDEPVVGAPAPRARKASVATAAARPGARSADRAHEGDTDVSPAPLAVDDPSPRDARPGIGESLSDLPTEHYRSMLEADGTSARSAATETPILPREDAPAAPARSRALVWTVAASALVGGLIAAVVLLDPAAFEARSRATDADAARPDDVEGPVEPARREAIVAREGTGVDDEGAETGDVPIAPPTDARTETTRGAIEARSVALPRADEARSDRAVGPPAAPRGATSRRDRPVAVEPPAAPAAPAGEGEVAVVTSGGWAIVYEDGRPLGPTPARFRLPAGRHVLEVRFEDVAPGRMVTVDVRPGETTRVPLAAP